MYPHDLKIRTFHFAVNVGRLVAALPNSMINRAYSGQIVRSSASVGANYRAALRAKSNADFINKLKIVEEETDETIYFLQLLAEFNPINKPQIAILIDEGTQILRMMVAAIVKARNK
jgi:four helix bundle protein